MAGTVEMLRSIAFYLVFYGGTVGYVLAALLVTPFSRRALVRVVGAWSRFHCICARWILGIRIRVEGAMPPGQTLIAMKHESFYEAINLGAMFGDPVIFAKAELLRIPLWGRAARDYGLVAVERAEGARALRSMIAAARATAGQGRNFVIFPEGTRVPVGSEPPLQAGFAALYKLLGVPVVPIAVDSGRLYHRRWKRPGTITFRIGEPIPTGLSRAEIEARVLPAINAFNRDAR